MTLYLIEIQEPIKKVKTTVTSECILIQNSSILNIFNIKCFIFVISSICFFGLFSAVSLSLAAEIEDEDLLLYLEYPDDWTAEKVLYSLVFTPPEEDFEIFSITRVGGLEGYSLEEFVNEQITELEFEIGDAPRYSIGEPIVDAVAGVDAYSVFYAYTSTLEDATYGGYRTVLIENSNGYIINFHTDNDTNRPLYLGEVRQILESIVFLDSIFNDANWDTGSLEEVEEEEQETMRLVPGTCFGPQGAHSCFKFQR